MNFLFEDIFEPGKERPHAELYQYLGVDPIIILISSELIPLADSEKENSLLPAIQDLRMNMVLAVGYIFPIIRLFDSKNLQPYEYQIKIRGKIIATHTIYPDRYAILQSHWDEVFETPPSDYIPSVEPGREDPRQVFDYMAPTKTSGLTEEELAAYDELEQAVMEYVIFEKGSHPVDLGAYPEPDEREPYTDPSFKALFARRVADAFYQADPERQAQIIDTFRDDNDGSPGTKIYLSDDVGPYGGATYWPGYTGVNSGIEGDPGDIIYSMNSFILGVVGNNATATDIHEVVHYLDFSNAPEETYYYLDNYLSGMPGTNETVGEEIRELVRELMAWYFDENIPGRQRTLIHESLRPYFFVYGQAISGNEGQIEQSPVFMEAFFERPDMILNPHPDLDPAIKANLRQLAEIFGEYTHPYEFFIPKLQKVPRLEITSDDQFHVTENRQIGTTVGVVEANDISYTEEEDPNITYEMGTTYPGSTELIPDPRFYIDEDGIIRTANLCRC